MLPLFRAVVMLEKSREESEPKQYFKCRVVSKSRNKDGVPHVKGFLRKRRSAHKIQRCFVLLVVDGIELPAFVEKG